MDDLDVAAGDAEAGRTFLSQVLEHMGEQHLVAAIVRQGPGQVFQVDQLVRLAGGLAVHVQVTGQLPLPTADI